MTKLQLKSKGIRRLTCRQLKCGGWLVLVALCKFALLLAMFRASAPLAEINYEIVEQSSVETACAEEGRVTTARSTVAHKLAVRALHREMGVAASGSERPTPGSCPRGHRLSNGLNAPRLC
jgi:hypothetical protein